MSEVIKQQERTLKTFIYEVQEDFNKVMIDSDLDFIQEAHFAVQILENNDYALNVAKGHPKSLKNAITNVATIGLSLNPSMGLSYLVPRKNQICLDISYLGFIKLAQDCGSVIHVKADLVYENDEFIVTGAFSEPTHKYKAFGDRGNLVGAYCIASTPEGSYLTTIMDTKEILEIRDSSESYKNERTRKYSPWVRHTGEMIKKTVIRRAYKAWPKTKKTSILDAAIKISDDAQAIEFKTDYQIEQEQLDKDFPIPPEEKEIGSPDYRILNAKHRGKKLKDIDMEELSNYYELLEKRHEKNEAKLWELEVKNSIVEYLKSIELAEIE